MLWIISLLYIYFASLPLLCESTMSTELATLFCRLHSLFESTMKIERDKKERMYESVESAIKIE